MMRKLAVTLALASTALATPALARDDSWYVGVEAGSTIVEDIQFDITNTAGVTTTRASTLDHHYGYDFDGLVGYDFGGFRLEAEVGYKGARVDGYNSTVPVGFFTGVGSGTAVAPAQNFVNAGRSTTALSFMVNGLLDFGDDDGIQGFIGGGAGVARIKEKIALNNFGDTINDSDTKFAWQAIAGVRSPITDNLDVTLKYRFFNVKDFTVFNSINGAAYEARFRSHSILGGLTYNFGSPPEPVIEAPVTPPPPVVETVVTPPPPPPCSPGPYIVFFDWDKSDIKPEAASILDEAIAKYQTCGNAQVMLAGHADRSGSPTYNVGLSERRNASVQSYLTGHGVPGGVITTQAFGESRPRVDTADGVREVQNRRVEITYGPGSGM